MSKRRPWHPSAQRTARGALAARSTLVASGPLGCGWLGWRPPLWSRAVVYAALALCAACWVSDARAQSWVSDVQVGLSTGFEGSDTGLGPQWQLARTRIVAGFDLGNSESAGEAYGARAFIELQRSVTVGAELGYVRWFTPSISFFFGGVAVLAPDTLFGGTVAATYVLPMGERFGIPIWASINALPFGSDRGNDGVVVWTLVGVGVRGRL